MRVSPLMLNEPELETSDLVEPLELTVVADQGFTPSALGSINIWLLISMSLVVLGCKSS
jgi:hypothetical protein